MDTIIKAEEKGWLEATSDDAYAELRSSWS
jgi:hypothetical protein